MWSFVPKCEPRVMVAKTSFVVFREGRPVGLVPEGSLWVKTHPIVRAHRE
jgi:hypothetical protein